MNKFLLKFFLHTSTCTMLIVFVWLFCYFTIEQNAVFQTNPSTKYVILGSSHSECSFDDSIIDCLENFSRSGEAYIYTYAKVKCLLKKNPNIEKILVEVSNPFIYDDTEWLWSDKYLQFHYVTFAPLLSFSDHIYMFRTHVPDWIKTYPFFVKNSLKKIIKKDFDFSQYGGHIKSDYQIDTTYKQEPLEHKWANVQLHFLDKIVKCCNENNVEIIFVRSPLYPTYNYWEKEDEFQRIRNTRYGEIPFWDFGHFLHEARCFRDFQHVNQHGSEIFSKEINTMLKNK